MTVRGEYQGREVVLWVSLLSGLETISVDRREVSRKRSFGLSTAHELSAAGIDVERGVARLLPLGLDLRGRETVLATFRHPKAALLSSLLLLLLALSVFVAVFLGWRRFS